MNPGLNAYGGMTGLPFTNGAQIDGLYADAIQVNGSQRDRTRSEKESAYYGDLFGSSQARQQLFRLIEKVAPTHASVLISGESGAGKELVACAIHRHSKMKDKPFIALIRLGSGCRQYQAYGVAGGQRLYQPSSGKPLGRCRTPIDLCNAQLLRGQQDAHR